MAKTTRIDPGLIYTPGAVLQDGCVIVDEGGRIMYVGLKSQAPKADATLIEAPDLWLSPGLIDIHVHGGYGIAFGVGDKLDEEFEAYSKWVLKTGVTSFLCSIAGPTREYTNNIIKSYRSFIEKGTSGARAIGFHMEGPFLNPERKGAFNPAWLRTPNLEEAREYIDLAGKWLKQITMAPELPNAFEVAREFRKAGVTVALGHSATDYDKAKEALETDFNHVTHTYNAQTGLNHRMPGVVGAVLSSDDITGELIADGMHVHPAAMKVLLRALGTQRVVLITDAIPGAGLPDGEYSSIGQTIVVKDGKATLADGTFAGSTALLNLCVRNIHRMVGISVKEAIRMASLNPARVINMDDQIGSIATGKRADLILMDEDFNVHMNMVGGEILLNDL